MDFCPDGFYSYFNSAVKKGYSGTAVFSKNKPMQIIKNIWSDKQAQKDQDIDTLDNEGRVLALEFEKF